jgi:hypothetical protein
MPPWLIATFWGAGTLLFILIASGVASRIPSEAAACTKTCAPYKKNGVLAPRYTAVQTAGTRGDGPMTCECR